MLHAPIVVLAAAAAAAVVVGGVVVVVPVTTHTRSRVRISSAQDLEYEPLQCDELVVQLERMKACKRKQSAGRTMTPCRVGDDGDMGMVM
jgi:hypothetical protein